MYLSGVDEVVIIGDKPVWIQNITHIPFKDNPDPRFKERNIYFKMREACKLYDSFLMFNDDHFIHSQFDANNFPVMYGGNLRSGWGNNTYRKSVTNTVEWLKGKGLETLNYDIHTPIVYESDKFVEIMKELDWRVPYSYVIKSVYGNTLKLEGEKYPDVKVSSQMQFHRLRKFIDGRPIFSIGERSIGLPMKKLLEEYYPKKSKYEKEF